MGAKALVGPELQEVLEDRNPVLVRESGAVADQVQIALIVIETQQYRADLATVLVDPVATDDTIGVAAVLPLDPLPLALDVRLVGPLADDAITPGGLVLMKPSSRLVDVGCYRCQMPLISERSQERFEPGPPLGVGNGTQVLTLIRQQIERDKPGGDVLRQHVDSRLGRVDPQLERVEPGHIVDDDHDLTIDHRPIRDLGKRGPQLWEIPKQWSTIA